MTLRGTLLLVLLAGCKTVEIEDADGDRSTADVDCDDQDATVHPGATEICDGKDNDCNQQVDDGADGIGTWYADADQDGYGDDATAVQACEAPSGTIAQGGDCDDAEAAYHPGAEETCDDPNDYNCDGSTGYDDADGDGSPACEDCDDADAQAHPGATEVCDGKDDDCDGTTDQGATDAPTWYRDRDHDGYGDEADTVVQCDAPTGYVAVGGDCDDANLNRYPGAPEACTDTSDLNCDGTIGAGDSDGDGYAACDECDDADPDVHPGATELCNLKDDDCDGKTDESDAADASTWYRDGDGDGYGVSTSTKAACSAPSGYVASDGDCDDSSKLYHPGASETCTDTVDYNCDGSIGATDADGDGYAACVECDDSDAAVNPGATETCDGKDDDCDGKTDEADASDALTWYADTDGDGYGDASSTAPGCTAPSGYVADDTDCNDALPAVHPGATERCDTIDNDCDGSVDGPDSADATTWYTDADGDGYGDATKSTVACSAPSGKVASSTDCDDTTALAHPGLTEVCDDGIDNDCDGTADGCLLATGKASMADRTWTGASGDGAGSGLGVGDVDGDGQGDLLVGAPANDVGYLVYGAASSGGLSSSVVLSGDNSGDLTASAIGSPGDVDGDGHDDVLVGAPGYATSAGHAWLVYGSSSRLTSTSLSTAALATFDGTSSGDALGSAVGGGDLDGDGKAELLIGASGEGNGAVWLFAGSATRLSGALAEADADAVFTGATTGALLGDADAVATVDLDADGADDLVLASWTSTGAVVSGFYGGSAFSGTTSTSSADFQRTVTASAGGELSVSNAGDVDGDGKSDLLVGVPSATKSYLLAGGTLASSSSLSGAAAATFTGGSSDTVQHVTGGDLDQDGFSDVAIGSSAASSGAGRVYVFYGSLTGSHTESSADAVLTGDATGDAFGARATLRGDVDGDGYDDLAIGATGGDGAVSVFLGSGL